MERLDLTPALSSKEREDYAPSSGNPRHLAAILRNVSNSKSGLKKVRLITTPNGIGKKAHDLWVKNYHPVGRDSVEPLHPASHGSTESRPTGEVDRRPGATEDNMRSKIKEGLERERRRFL